MPVCGGADSRLALRWSTDQVRARSKFWYFLRKLKKVKKSNGQIIAVNEIFEKNPTVRKAARRARSGLGFWPLPPRCAAWLPASPSACCGWTAAAGGRLERAARQAALSAAAAAAAAAASCPACSALTPRVQVVKNYGIWVRYQSRTGFHNMYKEYRDTTLNGAVDAMYDEMGGRHRVRAPCIQIIKTATISDEACKRLQTTQFHGDIKFPLTHKVVRPSSKALKTTFKYVRPSVAI